MNKIKKLLIVTVTVSTVLVSGFAFAAAKAVPGWPQDRIAMGTVTDGGAYAYNQLEQRPVDSVFTYAGINGSGDRGQIILNDSKVDNIMQQTRNLESITGKKIMPTFVFYTVDGSDGVWAIQQDLDIGKDIDGKYLWKHYVNLISLCEQLEKYKDADHEVPATLILNPDFLGELHKQCGEYYCPIPFDQKVKVGVALQQALDYLKITNVKIPTRFLNPDATVSDYIVSINWLMHTFAKDVPFGWQDNMWAGDEAGHKWLHKVILDPTILTAHVNDEINFLSSMSVFDDEYPSDFIVFDKWERDVFGKGLDGAGFNNGYLYNVSDWNSYLDFVTQVAKAFNSKIMLWQIPGGHLQISGDKDTRNDHASTAASYFFGDQKLSLDLSNLEKYIATSTFKDPRVYSTDSTSVVDYLKLGLDQAGWNSGHMDKVEKAGSIFAILWGGGSTTGVVGLHSSLDDGGWLYNKIEQYRFGDK